MNNDGTLTPEQALWAPRRPVWDDWKSAERARLWQAVALACELDPSQFKLYDDPRLNRIFTSTPQQFDDLLMLAKSNIGAAGILKLISIGNEGLEESEIELSTFAAWAKSVGYKLPPEFPRQDEIIPSLNHGWPWGDHDTKLLRELSAAAARFWQLYDPSDPTTAPTNQQVIDWLTARGVAERTAEVMATILRADGLRTGPRK